MISEIITGIKSQIASTLPTYSEMPIAILPEENVKIMTNKKYAVLPGNVTEIDSVNRAYTCDQEFIIKLTDSYVKTRATDATKQTSSITLMDQMHTIYKALVTSKCGVPNIVMNVKNLTIEAPIYFGEEDTSLIQGSVTITYRNLF